MRALVIQPDGNVSVVDMKDSLEAIQDAVGGYIEAIYFGEGVVAYINEEGKLSDPPLSRNEKATSYWYAALSRAGLTTAVPGDYLVGPVVVFGVEDGEERDVPSRVVEEFLDR